MDLNDPVDVAARTAWGEARGCGAAGMQRVLNVIDNRAKHPRWWGRSIIQVCLQPYQFSCWLESDPNRAKLEAVTDHDVDFRLALMLAKDLVGGHLTDLTRGADSYYALSMHQPPAWSPKAAKTAADGWHQFCRVELLDPANPPPNLSRHVATA